MSLIEFSVCVDGEAAEAVCELINRLVPGGAVVEQVVPDHGASLDIEEVRVTVKAFLPADDPQLRRRLDEGLWHLSRLYPIPEPRYRELKEQDWTEAWKEGFNLQRVGRRLVIVPSWVEYEPQPDELVIRLDPGMAFGTGLHPTTRMCCRALENWVRPGLHVLDVGTGSGILAIAAARLGAARVLAVDTDATAVRVARGNVRRNRVEDVVCVENGTVEPASVGQECWDVVVANILARIIVDLTPAMLAAMRLGGWLIASGILKEQVEMVERAWQQVGLMTVACYQEGDWVTLVGQRNGG